MAARVAHAAVAAALREAGGNVAEAARMLRLTRRAVCYRVADSEELRTIVEDARESTVDHAERSLAQAVQRGEPWAVCFTLKTLGKSRGYVERSEVTGANGAPVIQVIQGIDEDATLGAKSLPVAGTAPAG